MTAIADGAVFGRLDEDGRLIAADAPLAELHERAGGTPGGHLAIPQIAALARLARRLGILLSRSVVAADGAEDIALWVRAEPDRDGVNLALEGWQRREPRLPATTDPIAREQDFLRAGADWLWETDQALRLTSLSVDAEPVLGPIGAFLGQPLTGLFHFIEGEGGALPILNALAEHRRFEAQAATIRIEGEPPVMLSGIPLIDGNGLFSGFRGMAVARERARPQPEPIAAPSAAGELPDAFGRQLDSALRSPLDRIVANAENIQSQVEGPIRSDYAEYAGDIASAGRHLLALVDDLVDLQAIERDDFEPRRDDLDVVEIARAAAGLLTVRANEKSIRIDLPAEDEMLAAKGDYKRVMQILVNLIGNAIRYAPGESQVWVRSEREGDLAAVIVADQGHGIAPEDQNRIFEKFERLASDQPGSGLGLYLSRRLARAMGGDIDIDSAPGQGARFVLTLPTD